MYYKLSFDKDSVIGNAIMFNRFWNKIESFSIRGTLRDSVIKLNSYQKGLQKSSAKGNFSYRNIVLKQNITNDNTPINCKILKNISEEIYTKKRKSIFSDDENYKALLGDVTFKHDTIIGNYVFNTYVTNGNGTIFYGDANTSVKITDVVTDKETQTIKSNRFKIMSYNDKYHIYFNYNTDYNFDGFLDLDFFTGNNASYGSHSKDVYLFNKKENKFILNREIQEAINGTSYEMDTKRKWLINQDKDGCCWHSTKAYTFKDNKLLLVKSAITDRRSIHDSILNIEKELINNEMKVVKRKVHHEATANLDEIYKIHDL